MDKNAINDPEGFSFALYVENAFGNPLNREIADIGLYTFTIDNIDNKVTSLNYTQLRNCNIAELERLNLDTSDSPEYYFWLEPYQILSSPMVNNTLTGLEIAIERCTKKEYCKNDNIIDQYLHLAHITVVIQDQYFYYKDIDDPIKKTNLQITAIMEIDRLAIVGINVAEHSYTLQDDWLILNKETKHFQSFYEYSVDSFEHGVSTEASNQVLSIAFGFTARYIQYDRTLYSFWDFIGQIGGAFGLLQVCGLIFIGFINSRLLEVKLLNVSYNLKNRKHKQEKSFRHLKSDQNVKYVDQEDSKEKNEDEKLNNNKDNDSPPAIAFFRNKLNNVPTMNSEIKKLNFSLKDAFLNKIKALFPCWSNAFKKTVAYN